MQSLADGINRLDEKINQVGMTHPEIKPLTDMFNKRKENLDGADVHQLAEETKICYQKLQQESDYLHVILERLADKLKQRGNIQAEQVNSMRIEVPGR